MNPQPLADPIRILFAISSLANEGPTRVLLNIIRNLNRECFAPAVLTFVPEKPSSIRNLFLALDVPVLTLGGESSQPPSGFLKRAAAYRHILEKHAFQIVHAHCPRSLFYVVASTPKDVKTAYTVHCYPTTQFRALHGLIKGSVIALGANLAVRRIDKPIACADSVAAEYMQKHALRILAVNNGIEPLPSATDRKGRSSALASLGLDPDSKYLLFVGRLSAEKRILEFVRTFRAANIPNFQLVILGAGPQEAALRAEADSRIHLVGFCDDIQPYLAACDIHVSPSATEGLANSLLEAMSVGMPSLLSPIPSHQHVLQRCDGIVGELFDPTSSQDLRRGVEKLVSIDGETERERIRACFHRHFHARAMTNGYEIIYRDMVA